MCGQLLSSFIIAISCHSLIYCFFLLFIRLSYVFVLVLSLEMSNICVYPVGFQTSAVTVSESFETLESIPLTVSGPLPPLPANIVVQVSFLNGTGGVPSKSKLAV